MTYRATCIDSTNCELFTKGVDYLITEHSGVQTVKDNNGLSWELFKKDSACINYIFNTEIGYACFERPVEDS